MAHTPLTRPAPPAVDARAAAPPGVLHDLPVFGAHHHVCAAREGGYTVQLVENLLGAGFEALERVVGARRALVVTTPTVARLYAGPLHRLLAERSERVSLVVLPCSEQEKSPAQVEALCRAAVEAGLDRSALLLAVGGGVLTDVVTMAAAWIRRGVGYACVPTTLLAQVDAAIGVKGAVNFMGKKSYLGCYHPPAAVLVDPAFLSTLPPQHLRYGLSEIVKMAVIRDARLFELVERHGRRLVEARFQGGHAAAREVIWRAVTGMLAELEPNLYETATYERLVDFGHTISPVLEAATGFQLHHAEAVSLDMAVSAALAARVGSLAPAERDRIVALLSELGLPVWSPLLTVELCLRGVEEAALHRGGRPNLVIPVAVGRATFLRRLSDITARDLAAALRTLAAAGRSTPRAA